MKGRGMFMVAVVLVLVLGMALVTSAAQQPARSPSTVPLVPVGTAFTYQGRLTDGEQPADGTYDLLFNLYVEETDTTPIDNVEVGDVAVSQGLFTAQVDFGEGAFRGEQRYLEIGVRPGNSEGEYVLLTPRQRLLSTPYALALPGLWTQQNETSPNLIGGYPANYVAGGVEGATIGGGGADGQPNQVTSHYGTVAGGAGNWAGLEGGEPISATYATIGGGGFNRAAGGLSTVGGGWGNEVHDSLGTVGGGLWNIAWGEMATIGGGGRSNPEDNTTGNRVTDNHGTVGGGGNNQAGDGHEDLTNARFATVGGGESNTASGGHSVIGGGLNNVASGGAATISGGEGNVANNANTTIGGGGSNTSSHIGATVGGGDGNTAAGFLSTVSGGYNNAAREAYDTVGGGELNTAGGGTSTVSGGLRNVTSAGGATVGGGEWNTVSGRWATIGGGEQISVTGQSATVGGGTHITVTADFATVGGGSQNEVSGPKGTIGGGQYNSASGQLSTIGGGARNTASGGRSTIPGGIWAVAPLYGQMAYASGRFSGAGDAQASLYVLRIETSDDITHELSLDGIDKPLTVALSRTVTFDILVVARSEMGQSAGYSLQGVIENVGGTTSFVGAPFTTTLGADNPDWKAWAVADDSRDALILKVTGKEATQIRWVATVRTAEVGW